jgi:hypothetical protein
VFIPFPKLPFGLKTKCSLVGMGLLAPCPTHNVEGQASIFIFPRERVVQFIHSFIVFFLRDLLHRKYSKIHKVTKLFL